MQLDWQLELVPLNLYRVWKFSPHTWLHDSKVEEMWLDTSVAKAVTCKWLRVGAGTSKPTWPRQRKSGSAPRRTSSIAESETSGRLRWHTPSRRTTGPVEKAKTGVGSVWEDHQFFTTSGSGPKVYSIFFSWCFKNTQFLQVLVLIYCGVIAFIKHLDFQKPLKKLVMVILCVYFVFLTFFVVKSIEKCLI